MRLHLGAHLSWYDPQRRSTFELALDGPTPLAEIARSLDLPRGEIAIAAVNNQIVSFDEACVVDGDSVHLYPPVGAG